VKKTLIATALVALALPAAAAARIVPQRGIAGANLDMTQAQVRTKLGKPDKVGHPTSPIFGEYTTWFYDGTSVDMFRTQDRKVFNVSTTSKAQKTATGVGVGSTAAAVKKGVNGARCNAQHCWVGRFEGGSKVTDFRLSAKGRVTRVTIGYVLD
jgi:opacity protein-like surface antigen